MDHDDRNGHTAYNFFYCGAMISSLAKVTGLQCHLLLEKMDDRRCREKKHDSGIRKYIQCDRSDDIRRTTCFFEYWKFIALGIGQENGFCGLPIWNCDAIARMCQP